MEHLGGPGFEIYFLKLLLKIAWGIVAKYCSEIVRRWWSWRQSC
jgi:hypothetical protein